MPNPRDFWTKLHAVIYTLFTVAVLYVGIPSYSDVGQFIWRAGILTAILFAVEFIWNTRILKTSWFLSVQPVLFLLGFFGFIASLSSPFVKFIFEILIMALFFSYNVKSAESRPSYIEDIFSLVTAFLAANLVWSVNFYLRPGSWFMLVLSFALFLPIFWQAFYKFKQASRENLLLSLFAALIMVEVSWTVLFLPVYFLTGAVVSFSFYYLIYMLARLHFAGNLNTRQVYFHAVLISVILLSSLFSSIWSI